MPPKYQSDFFSWHVEHQISQKSDRRRNLSPYLYWQHLINSIEEEEEGRGWPTFLNSGRSYQFQPLLHLFKHLRVSVHPGNSSCHQMFTPRGENMQGKDLFLPHIEKQFARLLGANIFPVEGIIERSTLLPPIWIQSKLLPIGPVCSDWGGHMIFCLFLLSAEYWCLCKCSKCHWEIGKLASQASFLPLSSCLIHHMLMLFQSAQSVPCMTQKAGI